MVLTLAACIVFGAAAICAAQGERGPATRAGVAPNQAGPGGAAPGAPAGTRRGGFGRGSMQPPGPPAPVPPEVAIPRPSAEEVARMNEELQKFVNTNAGPNKDLLKKYASMLTVQIPRDNPCIRPSGGGGG